MSREDKALRIILLTAGVLGLAAACAVRADQTGDPEQGKYLAQNWCATCHTVDAEGTGSDAAPHFITIANDPQRSDSYLRGWLVDPHPPMPQLNLTNTEIEDIVAYLEVLRQE